MNSETVCNGVITFDDSDNSDNFPRRYIKLMD